MKASILHWILLGAVGLLVVFFAISQVKQTTLINTNRTAVIKEIQSLQRLETAQFTIEKVIDAQTSGTEWEQFLFGDKLLLIAHAQVIAGVDMSKITDQDISIQGKKITLTLPASELFMTDLDESKTQVYDRQKGLLTKGEDQLESQARQAAEQTMTVAACEGDILVTAANNARQQMEKLLLALGFEEVVVNAKAGSC